MQQDLRVVLFLLLLCHPTGRFILFSYTKGTLENTYVTLDGTLFYFCTQGTVKALNLLFLDVDFIFLDTVLTYKRALYFMLIQLAYPRGHVNYFPCTKVAPKSTSSYYYSHRVPWGALHHISLHTGNPTNT